MSIQDDEDWWWYVHMHVYECVCVCACVRTCVCDLFLCFNLGSLCVSMCTDFTRPVSECLNPCHLNQKAFCYSYNSELSHLRKSPHSCGPKRFQEFFDVSDGATIFSFNGELDKLRARGSNINCHVLKV